MIKNQAPIALFITKGMIPLGHNILGLRKAPLVWALSQSLLGGGRPFCSASACSLVSAMSSSYNSGTSRFRSDTDVTKGMLVKVRKCVTESKVLTGSYRFQLLGFLAIEWTAQQLLFEGRCLLLLFVSMFTI